MSTSTFHKFDWNDSGMGCLARLDEFEEQEFIFKAYQPGHWRRLMVTSCSSNSPDGQGSPSYF